MKPIPSPEITSANINLWFSDWRLITHHVGERVAKMMAQLVEHKEKINDPAFKGRVIFDFKGSSVAPIKLELTGETIT